MAAPQYLLDALGALIAARPAYDEAERFYTGETDEVFTSRRLRQLFADDNFANRFRVNYSATPVDVMTEHTQVQAITGSEPSAVALLNRVWEANELGLEAKSLHRMVYEFGDCCVIGWPSEELDGGVELYAHDPRNVRVFYDPQRPRRASHAVHMWTEWGRDAGGNPVSTVRVNLYWPDSVEQWVSRTAATGAVITGSRAEDLGDLVPYTDPDDPEASSVVDNPFDVLPVIHFRNDRPYGRPEHADAYGPQTMINKLNTTMMVAVDYAGFPQRYVLTDSAMDTGFPADAFSADDQPLTTESTGLSPDSQLESGPGSTWLLSGSKLSVGEFTAAETQNFLNAIGSLINQLANVTDIPLHYYNRSGQMPSGESFRQANRPLDAKVEDRHAQLGVSWRSLFDLCLLFNGVKPSDATVAWLPPAPATDKETWETAKLQQEVGVPTDEVLLERGYMPTQVAAWTTPPPVADAPATPTTTAPAADPLAVSESTPTPAGVV